MTAAEGTEAARVFAEATIVPLLFEGWEHFSESRPEIDEAFTVGGLTHRLQWPEADRQINLSLQ